MVGGICALVLTNASSAYGISQERRRRANEWGCCQFFHDTEVDRLSELVNRRKSVAEDQCASQYAVMLTVRGTFEQIAQKPKKEKQEGGEEEAAEDNEEDEEEDEDEDDTRPVYERLGIRLDKRDRDGVTALHLAVKQGAMLLRLGAHNPTSGN